MSTSHGDRILARISDIILEACHNRRDVRVRSILSYMASRQYLDFFFLLARSWWKDGADWLEHGSTCSQ